MVYWKTSSIQILVQKHLTTKCHSGSVTQFSLRFLLFYLMQEVI